MSEFYLTAGDDRILLLHAFSKVFEENLNIAFTTMMFLQTYADVICSVNKTLITSMRDTH